MLFLAVEMALQFDVDISLAEDIHQILDCLQRGVISARRQSGGKWAFVTPGEAHQALAVLLHFLL